MDSLYSCLIIEADSKPPLDVRLFSYGLAQSLPGMDRAATRAHTNIPRSGDAGLPASWEMFVYRWSFKTNVRLDEPVLDWAAETHASLRYSDATVCTRPVMDLLMAPQDFSVPDDLLEFATDSAGGRENRRRGGPPPEGKPLWLRENFSYTVNIELQPRLNDRLQAYLVANTVSHKMILWCYLDGLLRKGLL